KFALVRACSAKAIVGEDKKNVIDQSTLLIDANIMLWACELSRVTITGMELGAKDEIVDSNFARIIRNVRNAIAKGRERGVTARELKRTKVGKMPERDFIDVMKNLVESGDVHLIKIPTKGRDRDAYVYKDFIEEVKT
ncbi:MAG: hypothetical protein DWI59_06245, partial [Chloroflexi bacterium]